MKKIWTNIKDNCVAILYIGFGLTFVMLFIIGLTKLAKDNNNKKVEPITPVEESRIDTLYLIRDSLIYRTKYLDSVKYDTIEKVYKLNDTATLQLFLQLVSE